jgi:baculoviral IAP repeat-containing protein 7/8
MASTAIIQPADFTKHSYHEGCTTFLGKCNEQHEKNITPLKTITKQENDIPIKTFSFNESDAIKQVRIRSLSHWPLITPSGQSMSNNGWFSCNVSDRVICIYCNTICRGWTKNDDPCEVHTRLAPQCPFVLSMSSTQRLPTIINDTFIEKFEPFHSSMAEISRREKTFSNEAWKQSVQSIEDLVRAGFFFAGVGNTVTCFYCNGSLHKWGPNDNPTIEHARWFPNCTYAKHLCGNQLYGQLQASKKRLLTQNKMTVDEVARAVASRLDLPVVERLRSQYQIAVIKRCIEDQFKIKNDDFKCDTDLTMACFILQKQINIIQGSKDKIIVPSQNRQSQIPTVSLKRSLGECVICLTEEKQLACMPCGHLCACVPCGYALRSCPVCRQKIQCFMRINS